MENWNLLANPNQCRVRHRHSLSNRSDRREQRIWGLSLPQHRWNCNSRGFQMTETQLIAGDVIVRTISRRAIGTTAMLLPPVPATPLDGVKIYNSSPMVKDNTDRGSLTSTRVETLKYQFEKAGTFELPAITVRWWDIEKDELVSSTLAGQTFNVSLPVNFDEDNTCGSGFGPAVGFGDRNFTGNNTCNRIPDLPTDSIHNHAT